MAQINRKSVMGGFVWLVLERVGAQGVTFVVSIILARIINPDVYGTVAIVTVFTTILGVFVDSGMGSALIQKKDADDIDFSSVFYTNILFCFVLYALMFFIAPLIASFYGRDELTMLVRVLCINLIIGGIKNVQQAYISRNMLFKRFFFATLGGTVVAAVVGIIMAYEGFGVWALVAQNLINQAIDTMILWLTVKWRPKLVYSFGRVIQLFSFGWKLLLASLINVVYLDLRQLVIGKIYSTEDLAYYNRGASFPKLFVTNINNALASILFPVMSQKQEDKEAIKSIVQKSILLSTYVLFPIMAGLSICATSLIRFILTDKWLFCVPYLRIFCFEYAFVMFNTSNLNSYQSIGRSDIYLRNEILSKLIGFVAVFVTAHISVMALALSSVVVTVISAVINAAPNKKMIGYGFFDQIRDMLPNLCLTIIMGIIVFGIGFLKLPDCVILIIQISVGILIYIIGSWFLLLEAYGEMIRIVKLYFRKE